MNYSIVDSKRADMTSFTGGTIQASRAELVKAFGPPQDMGDDKVQYMWTLEFDDGSVCTIYDWKKPLGFEAESVVHWNIGGHLCSSSIYADREIPGVPAGVKTSNSAGWIISLVHNAFREALKLGYRSAA